ncbi:LOG family protein [Legionella worsleiensis]|uniref:AMP nucleosidase n=1 Tax=Legionella worsleiensis TaxID=45076 RepID=A0A0W1AFW8_9GAMM|nr:LOG family protein [Legionella worsleiensis]KTD80234.1 lysine decarboxylase [Legionella worsleiensis]STY31677.1 lysine decarboxylase [Legionella worsleiensis]
MPLAWQPLLLGILEEVIEMWNAIKIGELIKLIGFLNIKGYFDRLYSLMNSCEQAGFLIVQANNIPIS